ncbi:hypothetical protein [Bradyrhizobium sp. SBR1B]|uniref:hypothetical protein n=1 Tax=Bradyrhizobium sp. SBR1B TaxID=2663836 RepID=UPI0016060D03|nr:hypothetical protein [Bradyrhizobium sp. SBR1B]MBB4383385.1 hypothetical protein [Bradyrhizobium sp. SBR1B]
MIRWSIQEIRRIAMKLAQRRIPNANILAWSSWRRAHQANARKAHLKNKMQL